MTLRIWLVGGLWIVRCPNTSFVTSYYIYTLSQLTDLMDHLCLESTAAYQSPPPTASHDTNSRFPVYM